MQKLIARQFKDDIKPVLAWMILPFIGVVVLTRLVIAAQDYSSVLSTLLGLSVMFLGVGPFVCIFYLATKDRDRFYGDQASFYSGLPLTSEEITRARIIHKVIFGLILTLWFAFELMIFFMVIGEASFSDLIELFRRIGLEDINKDLVWSFVLFVVSVILIQASIINFSITSGSMKVFGKSKKSAIILIFFGLSILLSYISGNIGITIMEESGKSLATINSTLGPVEVVNAFPKDGLIWPSVTQIVVSGILYYLTYFLHDRKLSVA